MNLVDKKEIFQGIGNAYNRFIIAPENPFTYDNPDMLFVNNGVVYALFIPNYVESKNFDHLLRRLFMSQTAYLPKMITIVLVNRQIDVDDYTWSVLNNSFCHIADNIRDVLRFVESGERINKEWGLIQENQLEHLSQYHKISRLSYKYHRTLQQSYKIFLDGHGNMERLETHRWSNPNKSFNIKDTWKTDFGIISFKNKRKESVMSVFQNIMTYSALSMYRLDNGYVYFNRNTSSEMKLLNTDWEIFNGDYPTELNNALSFSGYTPVCIEKMEDMRDVYELHSEIFGR